MRMEIPAQVASVAEWLAVVPGVRPVVVLGSYASGTARDASDVPRG